MKTFVYESMDAMGQEHRGTIEAASVEAAEFIIRHRGQFVCRIAEKTKERQRKFSPNFTWAKTMTLLFRIGQFILVVLGVWYLMQIFGFVPR